MDEGNKGRNVWKAEVKEIKEGIQGKTAKHKVYLKGDMKTQQSTSFIKYIYMSERDLNHDIN